MNKKEYIEILEMINTHSRYSFGLTRYEVFKEFDKRFREKFGKQVGDLNLECKKEKIGVANE